MNLALAVTGNPQSVRLPTPIPIFVAFRALVKWAHHNDSPLFLIVIK